MSEIFTNNRFVEQEFVEPCCICGC